MALLEEHLYAGEHETGGDDMYPAFLVVLTSGVGLAATRHMATHLMRLGPLATWALYCIHASKLAMLLLPQVGLGAMMHDVQGLRVWAVLLPPHGGPPTAMMPVVGSRVQAMLLPPQVRQQHDACC